MSVCGDCVEYDRENSVYGWCKRYNNSKVYENDSACLYFEETRSSSGTGCFLTTACCEYKGLQDDCHELTIMRKFRDEYLKSKQYGKEMIDAYYERAPKIVERINQSDRKNEMLDYIYKEICRLVELYEQNKCSDIAARYLQMMYKVDLVSMGEMR